MELETPLHVLKELTAQIYGIPKFSVWARHHLRSRDPAAHAEALAHHVALFGLKSKGAHRDIRNLRRRETRADFVHQRIIIFLPAGMPNDRIEVKGDWKTAGYAFFGRGESLREAG